MTSFDSNYLPKTPCTNMIMLGVRASKYKFEGNIIQLVTFCPLIPTIDIFITCKMHLFHPNNPRSLNSFQHSLQVQSFTEVSSKSVMEETWGRIHPEAQFFSSYEFMKPNKWYASKIQQWNRYRDISILKGRTYKEARGDRLQTVQNLAR